MLGPDYTESCDEITMYIGYSQNVVIIVVFIYCCGFWPAATGSIDCLLIEDFDH